MFLPSFFNKKPSCHFWLCLHLEPPRRRSPTPSGRMPAEARPASHARGAIMTLALSREEGPEVTPACSSQKEPHAPQPRAAMSQDERTGQVLLGCCPLQTAVHSPKPPRLLQGGSGWHGGWGVGDSSVPPCPNQPAAPPNTNPCDSTAHRGGVCLLSAVSLAEIENSSRAQRNGNKRVNFWTNRTLGPARESTVAFL